MQLIAADETEAVEIGEQFRIAVLDEIQVGPYRLKVVRGHVETSDGGFQMPVLVLRAFKTSQDVDGVAFMLGGGRNRVWDKIVEAEGHQRGDELAEEWDDLAAMGGSFQGDGE